MTIKNYALNCEISISDMNKLFIKEFTVTYNDSADMSICHKCRGNNIDRIKSESWTSANYCNNCDVINICIRADRMSGNFSENVYVYKDAK